MTSELPKGIGQNAILDKLFYQARTHNVWRDESISDQELEALYLATSYGPTSANCSPMRLLFVRSLEAKQRLLPAINDGNKTKVMQAPVTAIIAFDTQFHHFDEYLFPHRPGAYDSFKKSESLSYETAFRNSSMQGAYLILAARAIGIDCGPLSGFNEELINQIFFANTSWRVNFLCNLGKGDHDKLFPRLPRLSFEKACQIL